MIYARALVLFNEEKYSEVLSVMDGIVPDALSALFMNVAASYAYALERYDEAEQTLVSRNSDAE